MRLALINVDAVAILSVVPGDLVTSAEDHHELAGQIDEALTAAAPVVEVMPRKYGPVGATFIAAIAEFHGALTATGTALVGQYRDMSDALHNAAGMYASVDDTSAASIASSHSHDTTHRYNNSP